MSAPTTPPSSDELRAALRDNWPEPNPNSQTRARVFSAIQFKKGASWPLIVLGLTTATAISILAYIAIPSSASLSPSSHVSSSHVSSSHVSMQAISLVDNADLRIAPGSVVELMRDDHAGTVILLKQGTIWSHVNRRQHGRPFAVQAGDVRVEVVGTIFSVSMDDAKVVRVDALQGTVRVSTATTSHQLLRAPAFWSAHSTVAAREELSIPDLAMATTTSGPAAKRKPKTVAPAPPDPAQQYRDAKALEAAGAMGKALHSYRVVAASRNELAQDALYALGRLQLAQGQARAGESSLRRYRKRYPQGRYAQAVYVHLLQAWQDSPKEEESLRALANEFLRRFKGDPRSALFETWLKTHPLSL